MPLQQKPGADSVEQSPNRICQYGRSANKGSGSVDPKFSFFLGSRLAWAHYSRGCIFFCSFLRRMNKMLEKCWCWRCKSDKSSSRFSPPAITFLPKRLPDGEMEKTEGRSFLLIPMRAHQVTRLQFSRSEQEPHSLPHSSFHNRSTIYLSSLFASSVPSRGCRLQWNIGGIDGG